MPRHPAPYPRYVLDRLTLWLGRERRALGRDLRILDPMAGIGRIHDLPRRLGVTVGVEIEPEWASHRKATVVGDATALPDDWSATFDAVVTSCVYGNRMSDHHEAKDSCHKCQGTGTEWTEDGCPDAPWLCSSCSSVACTCGGIGRAMKQHVAGCARCRSRCCPACGGSGLSKRYTYRHALGRPLSPNNAGQMHWPSLAYKTLHKAAWAEAWRVLRPGALMLLNIKNHLADDVEQYVSEWHEQTLVDTGFTIETVDAVAARGLPNAGANGSVRVNNEHIIVARKAKP